MPIRDCARSCVIRYGSELKPLGINPREGRGREKSEDLPPSSLTVELGGKLL